MITITGWIAYHREDGAAIDQVFASRAEALDRAAYLADAFYPVLHVTTGFRYFKINEAKFKSSGWGVRKVDVMVRDEGQD